MLQIIINGIKFKVEVNKLDKEDRIVVFYENEEHEIYNVLYFHFTETLTNEELKVYIKDDLHSNNVKKFNSINKVEICTTKIHSILDNLEPNEYDKVLEKLDL